MMNLCRVLFVCRAVRYRYIKYGKLNGDDGSNYVKTHQIKEIGGIIEYMSHLGGDKIGRVS